MMQKHVADFQIQMRAEPTCTHAWAKSAGPAIAGEQKWPKQASDTRGEQWGGSGVVQPSDARLAVVCLVAQRHVAGAKLATS